MEFYVIDFFFFLDFLVISIFQGPVPSSELKLKFFIFCVKLFT